MAVIDGGEGDGDCRDCIGVVLSGGRSLRMGKDKGLCMDGGVPWSRIAYNKLSIFCNRVVLSINGSQRSLYLSLFSADDIILDNISYMGPLNGLVSVYERMASLGGVFFLLACDMIYIRESLMSDLLLSSISHTDYDFYLYKGEDGFVEPLCGIYRISFIERVISSHSVHFGGKGLSFQEVLDFGKGFYLPVDNLNHKYFTNVNSPEDLDSNNI